MVGNVILLVGSKNLLAVQVLPFDLIEQIGLAAVFDIVENRFRGHGALFALEEFCQRGRGERIAHIRHDVGDDPGQQVHIPDFVSLHDILELNGIEEVLEILFRGRVRIPEVCQVRHASIQQVLLETLLDGFAGRARDGTAPEIPRRKGIDHKLHIAAAR